MMDRKHVPFVESLYRCVPVSFKVERELTKEIISGEV